MAGGILGIPILLLVSVLTVFPATIFQFFYISSQSNILLNIMPFVGVALNGATLSFAIWYLILRFDMNAARNDGQLN